MFVFGVSQVHGLHQTSEVDNGRGKIVDFDTLGEVSYYWSKALAGGLSWELELYLQVANFKGL